MRLFKERSTPQTKLEQAKTTDDFPRWLKMGEGYLYTQSGHTRTVIFLGKTGRDTYQFSVESGGGYQRCLKLNRKEVGKLRPK